MNVSVLRCKRETDIEKFIIDQETKGTDDYKRLNKTLLHTGVLHKGECVVAIQYEHSSGYLTIIIGAVKHNHLTEG
jgi:hypothetical protein